jgi:hypothetical protein
MDCGASSRKRRSRAQRTRCGSTLFGSPPAPWNITSSGTGASARSRPSGTTSTAPGPSSNQVVPARRQRRLDRAQPEAKAHAAGECTAEQGGCGIGFGHAVSPAVQRMPRNTAHCAKACVDSGTPLRRQYLLVSLSSSLMSRPDRRGYSTTSCSTTSDGSADAELRRQRRPQPPRVVAPGRVVGDDGDAAREDGVVDVADPVGGHEQQAAEVFERAQELGDDGVVLQVVVALADVDVGLVQQQHAVPARGALQDPGEVGADRGGGHAQLAGVHAVQRLADHLRIDLGRQRLAQAGRAHAQDGGAARLARDQVLHQETAVGRQDVDQVDVRLRQHQPLAQGRLVHVVLHMLHVDPDVGVPLQVEQVQVAVLRDAVEAAGQAALAPVVGIGQQVEPALHQRLVVHAAAGRSAGNGDACEAGARPVASAPDTSTGHHLRTERRLQVAEPRHVGVVLAPELVAFLEEAVVREQPRERAARQVLGVEAQAPGHAGEAQARLGRHLAARGLQGVGEEADQHVRRSFRRLHVAHRVHQPGQQHAVLAALVEPAVDDVAAQPFEDGGHQQFQAGMGRTSVSPLRLSSASNWNTRSRAPAACPSWNSIVSVSPSKCWLETTRVPLPPPSAPSCRPSVDCSPTMALQRAGQRMGDFKIQGVSSCCLRC